MLSCFVVMNGVNILKKSLVDCMSMVPTTYTLSFAFYICFLDLTSLVICTCRQDQISG